MSRGRPDSFYERIADLYRYNGTAGSATFIGDLYAVPASTATRWIKEARRRGLLEPFAARSCYACGRPHDETSLQFDRERRTRWRHAEAHPQDA